MNALPISPRLSGLRRFAALLAGLSLLAAAPPARAGIAPEARALAKEVAAKLQAAKTLTLSATHRLDPSLGVGAKIEKGPIAITFRRPNQFYAVQGSGAEAREIAYDGRTLCVMHPGPGHHALESLRTGSIEAFSDAVDQRFGFRPPLAELLANDLAATLFVHVTSAEVRDGGWVGFARCELLHLEQDGMQVDLWVGAKDRLPRRMRLTFTDRAGHPTWDIRLKQWRLDAPVDQALFTKRPAADSQKVRMLKSR